MSKLIRFFGASLLLTLVISCGESDDICTGADCNTPPGGDCEAGVDCASNICAVNICMVATCTDFVINGSETDIDCGGDQCEPCAAGLRCTKSSDCESQNCTMEGLCEATTSASCDDGITNGNETDVDCGGDECSACEVGGACQAITDCLSGICTNKICGEVPALCDDAITNGNETDVDCGGDECSACEVGGSCQASTDCSSGVCMNQTCQAPINCGDGIINGEEICDDAGESANCDGDCTVAMCGDGVINVTANEICDDSGESISCNDDCTVAMCGDGVVNMSANETCDDGNADNSDDCTNTCVAAICGDGFIHNTGTGTETCDDGNLDNNDSCTNTCQIAPVCGNGVIDAGEVCDDGNASNNDDCTNACVIAICGDGFLHNMGTGTEACDDNNSNNSDGCTNACQIAPICGNGVINAGEVCDDGNASNNDDCTNACVFAICGDGFLHNMGTGTEDCDDNNDNDNDSCPNSCSLN